MESQDDSREEGASVGQQKQEPPILFSLQLSMNKYGLGGLITKAAT